MSYSEHYNKAVKYAASSDTAKMLTEAADNSHLRDDATTHGAIADSLEESGESPELVHLIKRQYGLGEFANNPTKGYFGLHQLSYPDNRPPNSEPLREDDNFSYHLSHSSPVYNRFDPHWSIDAISKLDGSKGAGYSFRFPHEAAHLVTQLFPEANKYIRPEVDAPSRLRDEEGDLFNDAQIYKGIDRG